MFAVNVNLDGANVIRYERLRDGVYYADFRRDKRLYPEVYHCVVQRDGSTEILSWSQHRSLEGALSAARRELKRLSTLNVATESKQKLSPP